MNRIGVHLIFGSNPEPFLKAALESVSWVDYYCVVNTAPEDHIARENEQVVLDTVPPHKLRYVHHHMDRFSFSEARNRCLQLADDGDYVFIVDSDDVHYPEFEQIIRLTMSAGYDMIVSHFWHLIGYKDLWGQQPHREIIFTKTSDTKFSNDVHESLAHPRNRSYLVPDYNYVHYGYIKPPREIFSRWVLYSNLEGNLHYYDGCNPDEAISGWFDGCQPFWQEHPPAVQEILKNYPNAPASARGIDAPCNIGLVLLTWNDAENLKSCLASLIRTRQPFELVVVDNHSTDSTISLINGFSDANIESPHLINIPIKPHDDNVDLARALNIGFNWFMNREDIDYIGWIHPDMIFEQDTWLECLRDALDKHPDIVKVGAYEINSPRLAEPWPGNSQCYLVRKSALERVGLFDERFEACGGYEDWEINWRLSKLGKIMIWPDALIRHNAMGTRKNHDNVEAARKNAELYYSIVGSWDPVV